MMLNSKPARNAAPNATGVLHAAPSSPILVGPAARCAAGAVAGGDCVWDDCRAEYSAKSSGSTRSTIASFDTTLVGTENFSSSGAKHIWSSQICRFTVPDNVTSPGVASGLTRTGTYVTTRPV